MSAFFRVIELKVKIDQRLLKPIDNSECREILKLVYNHVDSFEEVAKTTLNTDLDKAITGEVGILKDMVDEIDDSKSEINEDEIQNIKDQIRSFITQLMMLEHKYSDGVYNVFFLGDEEDDDHDAVTSEVMLFCEAYDEVIDKLMSFQKVTSLVGMPGIGKTALAIEIFYDPRIVECFDSQVWIQVGKNYRAKDIPRLILEEIEPDSLQMLPEGDEKAVAEHLKKRLKSNKYLIVLDDVWDRFAMNFLNPTYLIPLYGVLDQPFFHHESGSRFFITSRLQQLDQRRVEMDEMITMRLLDREESWDLLRYNVFSEGSCPPQLEKAGMKIAENCEGLPLTVVTVARLLSQEEEKINPEYWNEVAEKKNHQIFLDAYDEISKVLLPSYTYLPPLLQMCFMFIGLFPKKYEVPRSRLINLWLADGFSELNVHISSNRDVFECLEELIFNNLVMVYQYSSYNTTHDVKTCGLHSSLWHLSKKKASETRFALLLSSRNDGLRDDIEGHHRLSFQNNVLFGIKDVHKSVEDNCASAARSLFCFGPYHQYQVPLCFRLKLLKELDALSIRFYEFPVEVLELFQLVYLSLTVSGLIPTSISQLQFLEYLIVDRHQNIKSFKEALYLPVEIWSLQKLKHLQVMGSDLPDPGGASLSCLSTLSNVSSLSCNIDVLKGIPNLKELRIRIELAPDDDGKPLICFDTDRISYLCKLHSLKCVIVNPEFVPPIAPFFSFPKGTNLTKLSLSGLCYPWKDMKSIGSIESLRVLKLKNYAFQGPEWEVGEKEFRYLRSLIIEDTDLVNWKFGGNAFGAVVSLKFKQCYKLKNILGKFTNDGIR